MLEPPELLYEDEHIQLLHQDGSSDFILATFSNYGFKADGASLWGKHLCEKESIETYGFVAKSNNWFPGNAMATLLQADVFRPGKPVVAYGHSFGGYAALKYSSMLGATGVVACAPQYSINPKSVPNEHRFRHHFSESLHRDMDIKTSDLGGDIIIVYDPCDAEDSDHVSRIREQCGDTKVELVSITNIGHSVMEVLRNRELVLGLFHASLHGSPTVAFFHSARQLKKSSHSYGYHLAGRLLHHKRPRLALAVLDVVLRNSGPFAHYSLEARYAELRSKAYVAMHMMPEALEQSERAALLEPDNPRFQTWHEQCVLGRVPQ